MGAKTEVFLKKQKRLVLFDVPSSSYKQQPCGRAYPFETYHPPIFNHPDSRGTLRHVRLRQVAAGSPHPCRSFCAPTRRVGFIARSKVYLFHVLRISSHCSFPWFPFSTNKQVFVLCGGGGGGGGNPPGPGLPCSRRRRRILGASVAGNATGAMRLRCTVWFPPRARRDCSTPLLK